MYKRQLQQGLKKEASAVLSQVLKEEPDNEAAKSKLEASVQGESVAPTPEEGFSQTAPLTPPWLKPGADPLQVPAHPSAPVVEELPDLTTAVPEPSVAAPVSVPSSPPRAAGVGAKKKARERMLAGLQALLDATQREAEHQRATEAQTFQGANQEHRT